MIFFIAAGGETEPQEKWLGFCALAVFYSIVLRLAYLGGPNLFFEEAYYWNYARHLDIGYLDHPPLVAWLIWPFTTMLGNTELGVRFGAFVCWLVTAYYVYRLTWRAYSATAAYNAVLLVATLPIYFATGLVMTPDAPLIACWSGTLYYLYRALIDDRSMAWLGVGIFIGLGMLSKYSMLLLWFAVLGYILIERDARQWLLRWEPYMAAAVAFIIFSPVIVWNMENHWASFMYQGPKRAAGAFEFAFPYMIASIVLLLTPTGVLALMAMIRHKASVIMADGRHSMATGARVYRLMVILVLLPLAVFAGLSLFRESKFHWTGPLWLGALPFLAAFMGPAVSPQAMFRLTRRLWPATLILCLLCYGGILHYWTLGFPGVAFKQNFHLLGWRDFARQIEAVAREYEHGTGEKPLVVGMDRIKIASGLAFYRTRVAESEGDASAGNRVSQTASGHLFGGNSLMYRYWFPPRAPEHKNMLLVSKELAYLATHHIQLNVATMAGVKEIVFKKHGKRAGRYYYRFVKDYRPSVVSD